MQSITVALACPPLKNLTKLNMNTSWKFTSQVHKANPTLLLTQTELTKYRINNIFASRIAGNCAQCKIRIS